MFNYFHKTSFFSLFLSPPPSLSLSLCFSHIQDVWRTRCGETKSIFHKCLDYSDSEFLIASDKLPNSSWIFSSSFLPLPPRGLRGLTRAEAERGEEKENRRTITPWLSPHSIHPFCFTVFQGKLIDIDDGSEVKNCELKREIGGCLSSNRRTVLWLISDAQTARANK